MVPRDEVTDLPVDPWLLGAWLGDGHTRGGALSVGRADIDDMLTLIKERWPRRVSVTEDGSALTVSLAKLAIALLIEGAIFRLVKGLFDHAARRGFAHMTGEWPGEEAPEKA